jgi:hypothetical protein
MTAACTMHVHPVQHWSVAARHSMTMYQERDLVAAPRQTAEHLVQMDFGPAAQRVEPVLPVDDQQLQRPPPDRVDPSAVPRISASSTPLMKRGLSCVPYFSASMTRFLDGDARRNRQVQHLHRREPQDVAVDDGEAIQPPVQQ